MSFTPLCLRHLVNACEVKAHLIGLLSTPWRRLFLAAYTLAKPGCCCSLRVVSYFAALRGRLLYTMLYTVCKVERFVC